MTDIELKEKVKACNTLGLPWDSLIRKELSCVSMINSILCYDCRGWKDAEKVLEYEENSYHNYLEDYVNALGRKRVIELIQGQIDSIKAVKICVHVDSEGISYNSLVF